MGILFDVGRYDRIEILSGFANGAFLLFVSFFLIVESVERLLEPPELHRYITVSLVSLFSCCCSHGRVISIAFIGLIINAIGVVFFSQHTTHRTEHRNKARQDNMRVIMLHLFTDMISGIGVIISSWLAQSQYGAFMCVNILLIFFAEAGISWIQLCLFLLQL